jgi:flagellar biosynthesis/type III secretory pathway M-ring protein FliF/YscJ
LEVRLQRLRRLLDGRGEDAAKLLRTWLQQQKEAGGKRRR